MAATSTASGTSASVRTPTPPGVVTAWIVGYLAVGLTTALFQPELGQSPWYPTTAVGIVFLLTCGRRWWPLLLACELLIASVQYHSFWPGAISAVVTLGEEVAAVSLLRWRRFDPQLGSPIDALRLGVVGTLVAAVAAVVAVPLVRVTGFENADAATMMQVWFVGEVTGITVLAPFLLLVVASPRTITRRLLGLGRAGSIEMALVTLLGLGVVVWAFARIEHQGNGTTAVTSIGPLMLCLLPVLWIAIRFGRVRTSVFTLVVNVVGIVSLSRLGHDPGIVGDPDMLAVQTFMLVVSVAGLLVATAVDAQTQAKQKEQAVLDASPVAIITIDLDRRITSWNPAAERIFGATEAEVLGQVPQLSDVDGVTAAANFRRQLEEPTQRTLTSRTADGRTVRAQMVTSPLLDIDGQVAGVVALIEDVTAEAEALQQLDLLDQAIDQASEAVLITDTDARIVYANPATLEISGYDLHQVVGQTPRLFKSGAHEAGFYDDLWATVTDGRPWHGVLVNRAADGSIFEQDTTISPVTDADGTVTAYVSVARDLARERALEADLEGERAERQMVTEALAMVRRGSTASETALDLCDAVVHIDGIHRAAVLRESSDGLLRVLAVHSRDGSSSLPESFDAEASRTLRLRAATGSWSAPLDDLTMPAVLTVAASGTGTVAVGGAPIEWEGKNLGVLLCASGDPDGAARMGRRITTLSAIATHAAALLGPQLADIGDREAAEQRIAELIDRGAFHPVFQPVLDLRTRRVVGNEALTRFDDGTRPDLVFAEAHRAGLGQKLEAACIRAAIAESEGRIGDAWLSINASPGLALDGSLAAVLGVGHDLVPEVTEHVEINDYGALRHAIDRIDGLRVAVDDAGAGYASLRHILELRPDFVKLDIALIRGIESDPARQAMVAGMCHFAQATGTTLLAEGIETGDELRTLTELGVELGQGYLLGRPGPLA